MVKTLKELIELRLKAVQVGLDSSRIRQSNGFDKWWLKGAEDEVFESEGALLQGYIQKMKDGGHLEEAMHQARGTFEKLKAAGAPKDQVQAAFEAYCDALDVYNEWVEENDV